MPTDTYHGLQVVPGDANYGKVLAQDDHKERVISQDKDKEAVQESFPEHFDKKTGKELVPIGPDSSFSQKLEPVRERLNRRVCGIRAKWVVLLLALLILLAIALGVGLGVGLASR